MSRPRSRSPRNRFPWDEPDFNPGKILAALDASLMDRRHHSREGQKEHRGYFKEDLSPRGHSRSSPCSDDFQFGQQHHHNREESYRHRLSPHHDAMDYGDRGFSPLRDEGPDGDRHRGPFREDFQRFDNRVRSPHSPPRLQRERLPPSPRPGSRGRFRDFSSPTRGGFRGGAGRERGRRIMQGPNRERQRENLYQERSPPPKRQRREMDDFDHFGYRNKEEFGEQRYSVGTRDGFGRGTRGGPPRGAFHRSRPFVIEHNHRRMDSEGPSGWKPFDNRHDRSPDFDRHRSPRPMSSSQERCRTPNSRPDVRDDARGSPFRANWRDSDYHENRRSPPPQDRSHSMMYGNRGGPANKRGMNNPRPERERFDRNHRGKMGPLKSQPHFPQTQQRYQDVPQQRPVYRGQREDGCENANNEEASWAKEDRLQPWEPGRPRGINRPPPRANLDPKMPHQREQGWTDQKSKKMTVVTEETLTIKVDMSRPVSQKSQLCYSSDRQLSFDLVNVGRQRLDFLPMLEHSGTYRETAMHKGTFAQEIITLVHHVKELYFKGDSVTLNERFSAPQKGGYTEEEEEEEDDQGETETLTLDKRFSAHRGFSLNSKPMVDDSGLLFEGFESVQGLNQQPMRGPGDLRHDLERRRQEKLEGVKVTIPGKSLPQRPPGPSSEMEYSDKEEMAQADDEEFSSWPAEQSRRWEGSNTGPRRGAPYRTSTGPQRRNPRQRLGPNRRQNPRMNHAGSYW